MYFAIVKLLCTTLSYTDTSCCCVDSFWYSWMLNSIVQLFICLDWIDAVNCNFFLMPLNNLWSNYLPFLCIIYYRNKVFIISAYLDSECVTCGALLQNALVELLHTRNQLFLQSSDPSFLTAERITIKKFLWYHWWLMHNRISAAPCTPRVMLFAGWIAIYHAFSYYF